LRRTGRRSDDCSAIPLPVLDRLVNGNHVDRKLAVRSRLVQPAEELARLDLGCESSRLEPPTRLPVIGVLDQPRDNRRLVVNRRSCVAICHGSDYAWRRTGLASSFAALRASLDRDTDSPQESNFRAAYRSRSRDQLHVVESHDAEPVAVLLPHDLVRRGGDLPDLLDSGGIGHFGLHLG
jgi:hypothetical protein